MVDTYKTIKCPACGNTMKKIFIPSAGVSIDICNEGCGGIFFDNQELNYFKDGSIDNISEIKEALSGKNFTPVEPDAIRVCPSCSSNMVKNTFGGINNLEIDTCYGCGAIFLDNGELDIIRKYFTNRKQTSCSSRIVNTQKPAAAAISLQQFYKDTQIEQIENQRSVKRTQSIANTSFDILSLIFRILIRL